jgi:hypothetical protein
MLRKLLQLYSEEWEGDTPVRLCSLYIYKLYFGVILPFSKLRGIDSYGQYTSDSPGTLLH